MRWSLNLERSYAVGAWLFGVAAMVVAIVVVGGMTRLTGSGLSITEWRPLMGAIPPLSADAWAAEFAKYQNIPQYHLVNRGMSLAEFKWIYGWEWTHRLLARLVGVVFAIPFVVFLVRRTLPRRLLWRCLVILCLGALQGLVGWWMVVSGLSERISVAPERLATHLGLALILYLACVWTGLEAWFGRSRTLHEPARVWRRAAPVLLAAVFFQVLLGALVAGGEAGRVLTDWPLMGGRIFPEGYIAADHGFFGSLLHSAAAVQFNHRLMAYGLWISALIFAVAIGRDHYIDGQVKRLAWVLFGAMTLQAALGIWTLRMASPVGLSAVHQLGAVGVLTAALLLVWRLRRN
jgi:cytochrome c oxidase assembly protein subunit 15